MRKSADYYIEEARKHFENSLSIEEKALIKDKEYIAEIVKELCIYNDLIYKNTSNESEKEKARLKSRPCQLANCYPYKHEGINLRKYKYTYSDKSVLYLIFSFIDVNQEIDCEVFEEYFAKITNNTNLIEYEIEYPEQDYINKIISKIEKGN